MKLFRKIQILFAGTLALVSLASAPVFADGVGGVPARKGSVWAEFFPDGIMKAGQKSSEAKKDFRALEGKFVGVYQSASWCGPCRMFTPRLVEFYKKNKKNMEIVFRSADKTEGDMQAYIKNDKMKWSVVPFGKRVNGVGGGGIPNLTIFSPDGKKFAFLIGAGKTSFDKLKALPKEMADWRKENRR